VFISVSSEKWGGVEFAGPENDGPNCRAGNVASCALDFGPSISRSLIF